MSDYPEVYWSVPQKEIFEKIDKRPDESAHEAARRHMSARWGDLQLDIKLEKVHATSTYNVIQYSGWENAYVVLKEPPMAQEDIDAIIDDKPMKLYFDPIGGENTLVSSHVRTMDEALHIVRSDIKRRDPSFNSYYQHVSGTPRRDGELFVIDYGSWNNYYTLWRD